MSSEEGKKDSTNKLQFDLLPEGLEEVVRVLEYGAKKYAPNNWRKVKNHRVEYGRAAMRHVWDYLIKNETYDKESGIHHMAHAACCCLFAVTLDKKEIDVASLTASLTQKMDESMRTALEAAALRPKITTLGADLPETQELEEEFPLQGAPDPRNG